MPRHHVHAAPRAPRLRSARVLAVLGGIGAFAALLAPAPAHAGDGLDCLACPTIDQSTCPALARAIAKPSVTVAELGAWLDRAPEAPEAVRKAAAVLSIVGGDKARGHLEAAASRFAGNGALEVDLAAAAARVGSPSGRDRLIALLAGDDTRVRAVALSNLAALDDDAALPAARAALVSADPMLLATAATALGKVGDDSDGARLAALAARLDAPVPARRAALTAMALRKHAQGLVVASQLVAHPAPSLAEAALAVLEAMPTAWATPAVAWALRKGGLEQAAGRAAAAYDDEDLAKLALQAATATVLPGAAYRSLLEAVAGKPPPGAATRLLDHAVALDDDGRVATLEAVARLGDRSVVPRLVTQLVHARGVVANFHVHALEALTGERLGTDVDAWQRWLRGGGRQPKGAGDGRGASAP